MKELLTEGFLIRTTVLVPADAVTRQLGEVSPDVIILTLQKETAIAVCYFTLKAYVNKSLTDIASCTAFRWEAFVTLLRTINVKSKEASL